MVNARQVWYELRHAENCAKGDFCKIARCPEAKFLLRHAEQCTKEQCKYLFCGCAKFHLAKPQAAAYDGKDYFADMTVDVMREIVSLMDERSKFQMQYVNKRAQDFFQTTKYIRGVFEKIEFPQLRITQLADGSTMFHFAFSLWLGDGEFHIFKATGENELFRYADRHLDEAMEYVKTNYGIVEDHNTCDLRPAVLSQEFYDALALALQRYSFETMFVGSVLINDQFTDFFTSGRNGIPFDLTAGNVEKANTTPWAAGSSKMISHFFNRKRPSN